MSINMIFHIIIYSSIFYVLANGFKFFLKLKGNIDFSYMAIVIFSSYLGVILNINFGIGFLGAIFFSFIISIFFTLFVLFLSSKLDDIYFSIGTFTIFILLFQLAINLESITGGVFGISIKSQSLIGGLKIGGINGFLKISTIITIITCISLYFLNKTMFFKILKGWGENNIVLRSLGIKANLYKFFMILISSFLASLGGTMYSFYYTYINPQSFWLGMVILLFIIVFLSYNINEFFMIIISILILGGYEFIRFFKIVEAGKIGFFREILFALIVMLVSFFIFKKTKFIRQQ